MRKGIIILVLLAAGLASPLRSSAQSQEAQQLVLDFEKLMQFKQILTDLKKGYIIVKTGYTTIKSISEGSFDMHKAFLDGLLEVSPAVKNYRKVAEIINYQLILVKEYKAAYKRFKACGSFSPEEIAYLGRVYKSLLKDSLHNLDELATVVTSGDLRMSDDERLKAIDRIFSQMQDKVMFLRDFNGKTTVLAVQRIREQDDTQQMQDIYGLDN